MKLRVFAGFALSLLFAGVVLVIMSRSDDDGPFEFPTKPLSKDEQTALWERLKDEGAISWGTADFLSHNPNFVLHQGDLSIDKNFDLHSGNSLVVDGNLVVKGNCDDNGSGHLVVIGDMAAVNLISEGTSVVTGKLTVDELVYCFNNDHLSEFAGGVDSRAFFISDKDCSFLRENSTLEFFASDYDFGTDESEIFRHLRPELAAASFDESPFPDSQTSAKLIATGKSIFREKPASVGFLDAWRRMLEELEWDEELDLSALIELASVDEAFRIIIAKREDLDPQIQALLIERGEPAVLQALANNPETTSQHLAQISEIVPAARPMMAANPNAPAALVAELASDPDPDVRQAIASRDDITAAVAARLAVNDNREVRWSLAYGAGIHLLDEAALSEFARNADTEVLRVLLLTDAHLPTETYAALAKHSDPATRKAVAEALRRQTLWLNHQTLPVDVRDQIAEAMLSDSAEMVFRTAAGVLGADRQFEIGTDWLSKVSAGTRYHYHCMDLAEVTTSPALMAKFAQAEDLEIRESLAKNPLLTSEAQHLLLDPADAALAESTEISDELDQIVADLVMNKNVADDVLLRVAGFIEKTGTDTGFSSDILHHWDLPPDLLALLFALEADDDYRERVALTIILRSPRATKPLIGSGLIAWHGPDESDEGDDEGPILPEYRTLENLSGDEYWNGLANAKDARLREIAAGKEATPIASIMKLAEDESWEVGRNALNHAKMPIDHPLVLLEYRNEKLPDLRHSRISDETLLAQALRARKAGRGSDARELFEVLSRRKLRAAPH